jgi:hypothetical protein
MPNDELNDRPFLFVPHYPPPKGIGADTGQARPVPSPVIYYLCNGIHILSSYKPGQNLSFSVDVANWQGGNADSQAMVTTYWSPPLSGVAMPNQKIFLAFGTLPLPPQGGRGTLPLTAPIPADAPPHICLLAKVFHSLDMAPLTPIAGQDVEVADPVHERHWAQHNISVVPAANPSPIQFLATNPATEERTFQLRIQPISQDSWDGLRTIRAGEPVTTSVRISLSDPRSDEQLESENALTHNILLAPEEQREMTVLIKPDGPLETGTYGAYEVIQNFHERPTGGFAIILSDDEP